MKRLSPKLLKAIKKTLFNNFQSNNIMHVALCVYSRAGKPSVFKTITEFLKTYKRFIIYWIITKADLNAHRTFDFDYLITFSSYTKGSEYEFIRKDIENLHYKNIIYIESPPIKDFIDKRYCLYLRYSLNNVKFCNQQNLMDYGYINEMKKKIKLKITSKLTSYKQQGCILLLLQNPSSYQINQTVEQYNKSVNELLRNLRKYSPKKMFVRYKPLKGKKKKKQNYKLQINDPINNTVISRKTLKEDCERCYICISHSTHAVLYCLYHGLHSICLSDYCIAYEISDTSISKVTNPTCFSNSAKILYFEKLLNCCFKE